MLAVIILTYNEAIHISRAIKSVAGVATQIFIIDSQSSDKTAEIAIAHGAIVLQNKFINQATQFQWALDNAPIACNWVMRLDADEIIDADLATEISEKLPRLSSAITGINLKRKHIFMGKWVRHGGRYPLFMLRIWRSGCGRVEDRWMDEHIVVSHGKTVTFDGGFSDHNLNNLTFFIDKHNNYATREAIEILNQRLQLFGTENILSKKNTSTQAAVKRWMKEFIYNKLPFTFSAFLYFLWRYIFQMGFLDGRSGLVYHFLQGYWYRFLVGSKLMELELEIAHLTDKDAIRRKLSIVTGYELNIKGL